MCARVLKQFSFYLHLFAIHRDLLPPPAFMGVRPFFRAPLNNFALLDALSLSLSLLRSSFVAVDLWRLCTLLG